jgi:hypothetical protein
MLSDSWGWVSTMWDVNVWQPKSQLNPRTSSRKPVSFDRTKILTLQFLFQQWYGCALICTSHGSYEILLTLLVNCSTLLINAEHKHAGRHHAQPKWMQSRLNLQVHFPNVTDLLALDWKACLKLHRPHVLLPLGSKFTQDTCFMDGQAHVNKLNLSTGDIPYLYMNVCVADMITRSEFWAPWAPYLHE